MAETEQNDTMYVGNKRTLKFTVTDADNSGAALDLSVFDAGGSSDIKWALSTITADGTILKDTPVIEKKLTESSVVITNSAGGLCELDLVKSDTEALQAGDYYGELEGFDAFGEPVVLATGTHTLLLNVVNT